MSAPLPVPDRYPKALIVKLCSALLHLDEYAGPGGHPVDLQTAHAIMQQPDVAKLLEALEDEGLLPVKRGWRS